MWAYSKRAPFPGWGEDPHQEPPWAWTVSLQNCEKVRFQTTQSVVVCWWQPEQTNTVSQTITKSCWFFLYNSPCNHCFFPYPSHYRYGSRYCSQMNAEDSLTSSGFVLSDLLLIFPAAGFYLTPSWLSSQTSATLESDNWHSPLIPALSSLSRTLCSEPLRRKFSDLSRWTTVSLI